jgi:hypothetical protein
MFCLHFGRFFTKASGQPDDLFLCFEMTKTSHTRGPDVMIFKNIFAKKSAKKLPFLTQNKAKLCQNLIITLVFEKNANLIITSTPDGAN